jgi:hypothetical protein
MSLASSGRAGKTIDNLTMNRSGGGFEGIRQLVKAGDVAQKLGVSISSVIQHAAGKRKPIYRRSKWGLAGAL